MQAIYLFKYLLSAYNRLVTVTVVGNRTEHHRIKNPCLQKTYILATQRYMHIGAHCTYTEMYRYTHASTHLDMFSLI